MADYGVEVFRQEVDELTDKLLFVAHDETKGLHAVDRSIVIAAALANVACRCDGVSGAAIKPNGVTDHLSRMADGWRGR